MNEWMVCVWDFSNSTHPPGLSIIPAEHCLGLCPQRQLHNCVAPIGGEKNMKLILSFRWISLFVICFLVVGKNDDANLHRLMAMPARYCCFAASFHSTKWRELASKSSDSDTYDSRSAFIFRNKLNPPMLKISREQSNRGMEVFESEWFGAISCGCEKRHL